MSTNLDFYNYFNNNEVQNILNAQMEEDMMYMESMQLHTTNKVDEIHDNIINYFHNICQPLLPNIYIHLWDYDGGIHIGEQCIAENINKAIDTYEDEKCIYENYICTLQITNSGSKSEIVNMESELLKRGYYESDNEFYF